MEQCEPCDALDIETEWRELKVRYALADVEQQNGDFGISNALVDNGIGWAVAGHNVPGPRTAWFLTEEAFGYEGGTELRVTLAYDSGYNQHVLGRIRLATSPGDVAGLSTLPLSTSGFYTCGPFAEAGKDKVYDREFGPEAATRIDRKEKFGKQQWKYREDLKRGQTNLLYSGSNATFVAQRIWAATARDVRTRVVGRPFHTGERRGRQ